MLRRGAAEPPQRSSRDHSSVGYRPLGPITKGSAKKRRDVEVVVADRERVAAGLEARFAAARAAGALLAGGAQAAVVEAGGDHGDADLLAHRLVDHGAE